MTFDKKAPPRSHHVTVPARRSMVIAALVLSAIALLPAAWRSSLTEQSYDVIARAGMAVRPQTQLPVRIVVVDIDAATLELHGSWPWPRNHLATLVTQIASAQPAAFAMDMLLAHADQRSASALARQLAQETGRQDIQNLAGTLPDADNALASNLARMPSVLGFVLDPEKPGRIASVPLLMRDNGVVQPLWSGAGAIGPHTAFLPAMSGLGMIGLPGDEDGTVRRVPLFVNAGGDIAPGLALEAVRVWQKASAYIVDGKMPSVQVGNLIRPLPDDAMLRLVPARAGTFEAVTISARDILSGQAGAAVLSNAIVFLGGSAPELGGLRTTNGDALIASVRIQADAAAQLIHGIVPRPVPGGVAVAVGLTFIASLLGVSATLLFGPLAATLTIVAACSAFFASAAGLFVWKDWLMDPLFPSVAAVVTFGMSSLVAFAHTRQQEARIRRRFEQHLAPQVVSLIVANPHVLRLRGERREITAMFTDVESFTPMTEKAAPEELVQVLDDYFEGVTALVIAHGGMVDKFVGDAVHAMFNVPLDQDNHARQAVACALAIATWTETFRQTPLAQRLGFGRTRIGIETGEAIVGDIGLGSKLDYTAHGVVMNTAARMESANKIFGSTICLGPQVAQRCAPDSVRPLGTIDVRGLSKPLTIFEPWPEKADARWRLAYQAAMASIDKDRQAALAQFEALAHALPDDRVVRQMADRLRAANGMASE